MAHWAQVGVKCECVEATGFLNAALVFGLAVPVVGNVYTIRDVVIANRFSNCAPGVGLRLAEVRNPVMGWRDGTVAEISFLLSCFRPLITRTQKQDVELFAPLLDTSDHRELERV